jgi:hypothetical protein
MPEKAIDVNDIYVYKFLDKRMLNRNGRKIICLKKISVDIQYQIPLNSVENFRRRSM